MNQIIFKIVFIIETKILKTFTADEDFGIFGKSAFKFFIRNWQPFGRFGLVF